MEQFKPNKKSIEQEISVEDKKEFEKEIQKFIREFIYNRNQEDEYYKTRVIWEKPEDVDFDSILDSYEYSKNFRNKYRKINPGGIPTTFIGPYTSGSQIINPDTAFLDYENMGSPEIIDIVKDRDYLDWLKDNKKNNSVKSILEYVIERYSSTHHLPGIEYLKYLLEKRNKKRIPNTWEKEELYMIPSAFVSIDCREQFYAKNREKDILSEKWFCGGFYNEPNIAYQQVSKIDIDDNETGERFSPKVVLFRRKDSGE